MTLSSTLHKLASPADYPSAGRVARRWGQLLREPANLAGTLAELRQAGSLAPLAEVALLAGGAVPRANAYFLVRELPFEEIPHRFNVTKRDLKKVAVVEDGLQTLHRIERPYLKPVVKGPESLLSPAAVAATNLRLFQVGRASKEDLREQRANGALAYLKRGESVSYRVSEDSLKGGVPAQRSQVKNRKPYWYSITTQPTDRPRIVVPEHFDRRFPSTLLTASQNDVVLDKLFAITPTSAADAELILAGLHSLVALCQIEFRGRTNLGEGVLEMKRADWDGLLVPTPAALGEEARALVLEAFEPLRERQLGPISEELADPDRLRFDTVVLEALGVADPEATRIALERELRGAISERRERAASLDDAKASKATVSRVSTNVDAYASRIAASLEPHPDPRTFVPSGVEEQLILISGPIEGGLTIGEDLLSQGMVFAGGQTVADAGDLQRAQFVQGVLRHDPELSTVTVPAAAKDLDQAIAAWREAAAEWLASFDSQLEKTAGALAEQRAKDQVRDRALSLLHAS